MHEELVTVSPDKALGIAIGHGGAGAVTIPFGVSNNTVERIIRWMENR